MAVDSIIFALVRIVMYVSSFAQVMIMSRYFSKLEFGRYLEINLIVSVMSPFLLLGLGNALSYFYNKIDKRKEEYVETIYSTILLLGFCGGIFIILLRHQILNYFNDSSLIPLLYIAAFRPLFQNLTIMFQYLYISSNLTKVICFRNLILAISQFIIVYISSIVYNSIEIVILLLVVTDLIQVIFLHYYFKLYIHNLKIFNFKTNLLAKILPYSFPLALSTMIGTFTIHMDTMLIGKLLTTEQFALYANMARELPFNLFSASLTEVIFPVIVKFNSSGDVKNLVKYYRAYFEFGIITTWIFVTGAFICSHELVLILYSDKYIQGINIFRVYLLVSALRFIYHGLLLSSSGKSTYIFIFSFVLLITNFILNIIFFAICGIIGPAIATFFCVLLSLILQVNSGRKHLNLNIYEIINFRLIFYLVLKLFFVGIFFYVLKGMFAELHIYLKFGIVYLGFTIVMFFFYKRTVLESLKIIK